ncbi:hypothetical protein OG21DRAFT_1052219 [Imleria badia]|nr:hypothetical protein OG21DRAFT_1052219 [Imleria badia]
MVAGHGIEADMGKAETFGNDAKSIERLRGGRVDILIDNAAMIIGTGKRQLRRYQINLGGMG